MRLQSNKSLILGQASRRPNEDETNLAVGEAAGYEHGVPAPISLKGNGVVRIIGSYVYRDRIDTPGDTLVQDIMGWDLRNASFDPDGDSGGAGDFPELLFAPPVAACNFLFDGTSYTRQASAGAASVAADPVTGAMLVTQPGNWSQNNTPGINIQGTTTRAAGAAGVRHICTSIHATLAMDAASVPGFLLVNLRDGISGAGTILWSAVVIGTIGETFQIELSSLSIVGSAATAMTLEWNGGGGVNSRESVAITGYSVG